MFSTDYESKENIPSGGSPYFELKHSLQHYIAEKNWASLARASRDMLATYPASDFAYYTLGMAYSKLGNYPEAVTHLKKALYLNPDLVSADYQLGIAAYYEKKYVLALEHFDSATTKGMNTHFLHYNMGNAWFKLGDYHAAIQSYLRCLSICPDFNPAAYALFRVYFGKNDFQNAVAALRPVISNEKLPAYLFAQARLLYENDPETNAHQLREAHRLLSCAIDLDADFALAYYERAYVNSKLNDLAGFTRDKQAAFALNPDLRQGHTFDLFSSYYI